MIPLPAVTVVIPTRDRWQLAARAAVRSALAQEGVDVEVVVVDDGSRADMPRALPGLSDERVRVVRFPAPRGVAAARNAGSREARGEWVAFLDDDDLWSPTKLARQLQAADDVRAGFAYAGAVWVDEQLAPLTAYPPPAPQTLMRELLSWNVVWGGASNVVARRDLLESVGGFDEELFQLADWDLWIRLAQAAKPAMVDEVLVALVVHEQSMLLVDQNDVFVEFERLAAKHRQRADQAGVAVDRARFSRWVASGHLRAGRTQEAARAYVRGTRAPGNVLRAVVALTGPSVAGAVRSWQRIVAGHSRAPDRPDWLDRYA